MVLKNYDISWFLKFQPQEQFRWFEVGDTSSVKFEFTTSFIYWASPAGPEWLQGEMGHFIERYDGLFKKQGSEGMDL